MMNKTIGFIGAGVMGRSMILNLLKAGYTVNVYTRTKEKAQTCLDAGAVWNDSVADLSSKSDVIISIVGYPKDVEEVYLGEAGIVANAKEGTIAIDMTTSEPGLAARIAEEAGKKNISVLDAPVSGGDIGAREACLSIMVGGDKDTFDTVLPIFEVMGKNIVYQGKAGSGQHTKMCNQIAIAAGMLGICEAVAYARKSGLDPETVLRSISGGAAGSWSLSNLAPRILHDDFEPGFFVKHFIKDMTIALDAAQDMGLKTPGLELAKNMYEELAGRGNENDGTQALYKLYK